MYFNNCLERMSDVFTTECACFVKSHEYNILLKYINV